VFESNNILSLLSARIDYLSASADHQALLALHHLFIMGKIPLRWQSKTGV
jgi:hypothetical protein